MAKGRSVVRNYTGLTWQSVLMGAFGILLTVVLTLLGSSFSSLAQRVQTLEERQIPALERTAALEGKVQNLSDKVDELKNVISKLDNQIQMDRQDRSGRK